MKQTTWPGRADGCRFKAFPLWSNNGGKHGELWTKHSSRISTKRSSIASSSKDDRDYSELPCELIAKIGTGLCHPSLRAASLACKSWCEALKPHREAMLYMRWGKRFKHGRGVIASADKALGSFLKAASLGSTMGMVDAGLIYWEMGQKAKAITWYQKAADLGDTVAKCNLGISFLQVEPPNPKKAVKLFYQASYEGYARARYQLALCLHQGHGVDHNIQEAARWYLKAAEGGYVRAMYNVSLCYSYGEGFAHSRRQARKWMKCAADCGHSKAQFEHGVALYAEREMMKAVVYLELATRAGESAAVRVKNAIVQQLSETKRDHVLLLVNNWRALPSSSSRG